MINVTPGETLYIYVGGTNGYNGGANGFDGGSNGGGATDIRQGGTALGNRVLVAGGGGGGAGQCGGAGQATGGNGGGTTGGNGGGYGGGGGGTQSSGSSLGNGGNGGSTGTGWGGGGGGGGGYFGGGGGGARPQPCTYGSGGSGGGGSGLVPAGGGSTTAGVNSGNGYLTISPINTLYVSGNSTFMNGNVGIGTAGPSYPLHVSRSSDGDVAGFTDINGTCTINPTSTSLICSSDERLKKDIAKLDSASMLEKLTHLQGVNYKWKNQADNEARYGFIAQDVEQIFPEFVATGSNGYKSVAYGAFSPILVEATKELKNQCDLIESELTTVKEANFRLTDEISELKNINLRLELDNMQIKQALCELGKNSFCSVK